jgi:hypothetical protein
MAELAAKLAKQREQQENAEVVFGEISDTVSKAKQENSNSNFIT